MNEALLSIITHQFFIGMSPVLYKYLSPAIPSTVVVAIRWGFGAAVLLVWFLIKKSWHKFLIVHNWKQFAGLLFLGIFGAGVGTLWNVISVRNIGVVLATLIVNFELPLGVILGMYILKETISLLYVKAAAVILVGFILLLAKNGIVLPSGGSLILGVAYAFGASIIWASCTIVGKKLTATIAPSIVTFWRLVIGMFVNALLALCSGYQATSIVTQSTAFDWVSLLWLGVVTSGIGMVLYYQALSKLSVKHISLLFTISPIVSVVLGVATGEQPILSQWVGIALILSGIAYVFMKKEYV